VAIQARLVDDLLDTSKAIVGKLRLRRRLVDLAAICQSTIDAHLRPAHDKGLTLTFTAPAEPVFVSGDADRLQQTVSNVLSNAIKFTPAGGTVEVMTHRAGVRARVEVRDTGVGIPTEFLGAVFEPFSQADKTSTREFGGLGLGLAIVKQIVTLHGGTVTATSGGDNQGTTVVMDFPIPAVLDEASTTEQPAGSTPPAATDLGGVKVLVVDDEADARDAMRTILEHHGATVETAESASEALRLVSELRPDVLLTDLAMPDTDGYELLRLVRDLPSGHELPALALTAHVGVGEVALDAGFQEYTSKPVAPAQLISLIASLASGARH
jgi:CheY-like chemotaxis protein